MKSFVESVPNFSEGRRQNVIDEIVEAARIPGVSVLDVHSDHDHNRTVLTVAGEQDGVLEAVFGATAAATRLIDLNHHSGEHPRLGATDVVPFIPLGDMPMADAIALSHRFGRRVAQELSIPVYYYEEAATRPERQNLESVRGKGFEDLRDRVANDPGRVPDEGGAELHPTAGAVIVGARGPLVAYNVYLNTEDVSVAKAIARTVRYSSGGLRFVKALGLEIPARGQVQVSMNLTNFQKTAIYTVFNLIKSEAETFGVSVTESEIVGLVPIDALLDVAQSSLRMHHFDPGQVLELKLYED